MGRLSPHFLYINLIRIYNINEKYSYNWKKWAISQSNIR